MDRRDQELLDKQLRRVQPVRANDGTMILAIVAVFLAGVTLGGFLFSAYWPLQNGVNEAVAANQRYAANVNGTDHSPPIKRQ
jgi:hypothetical protein